VVVEEIIKLIGVIFTSIAAIYAFWKKVGKPLIDSYIEKNKRETERDQKIEKIIYQLYPNGGGSLADKVNGIVNSQKNILDNLEKSSAIQKVLMEQMDLAYWYGTPDGKCLMVSRQLSIITEIPESDFIGDNWHNVMDKSEAERIFKTWMVCKEMKIKWEEIYTYNNGIRVKGVAHPLFDADKNVIGWFGIIELI
jgi:PAS domain-containing protein